MEKGENTVYSSSGAQHDSKRQRTTNQETMVGVHHNNDQHIKKKQRLSVSLKVKSPSKTPTVVLTRMPVSPSPQKVSKVSSPIPPTTTTTTTRPITTTSSMVPTTTTTAATNITKNSTNSIQHVVHTKNMRRHSSPEQKSLNIVAFIRAFDTMATAIRHEIHELEKQTVPETVVDTMISNPVPQAFHPFYSLVVRKHLSLQQQRNSSSLKQPSSSMKPSSKSSSTSVFHPPPLPSSSTQQQQQSPMMMASQSNSTQHQLNGDNKDTSSPTLPKMMSSPTMISSQSNTFKTPLTPSPLIKSTSNQNTHSNTILQRRPSAQSMKSIRTPSTSSLSASPKTTKPFQLLSSYILNADTWNPVVGKDKVCILFCIMCMLYLSCLCFIHLI